MGAYEAIGMMKKAMEEIKEREGTLYGDDIKKLVGVLDAVVFALGELNRRIDKLEEGGGDRS